MKTYFSILSTLLCLMLSLSANATRETGGVSPPPIAVVLQGHLVEGEFDYEGWQKARHLAEDHLVQKLAVVVTEPARLQYPDRIYLCVEYNNNEDFNMATQEFKNLLNKKHPSIEVIQNTHCP